MGGLERISIYVPEALARDLDADAVLFEIYKRNGRSVNRNRFLNQVFLGHYETFVDERLRLLEVVTLQLGDVIESKKTRVETAERIVRSIVSPVPLNSRVKGAVRLSLKPTRETKALSEEVISQIGHNDSVSRFFYSLLSSYRSLPSYERERVVFRDTYYMLRTACETSECVTFTTTQKPSNIHRVVPFKICEGRDGQLNYLLCYEEDNPERKVLSFRLNRIANPRRTGNKGSIPRDAMKRLSMMEHCGPQFSINEETNACVRLTKEGARKYQRVYINRPECKDIQSVGDGYLYFFNCSQNQLFQYLRRFGAEAEVLDPIELRDKIIKFHMDALKMYGDEPVK